MRWLALLLFLASCASVDPNAPPALRALNVAPHEATMNGIQAAVDFTIDEADVLAYHEVARNDAAEAYIAARFKESGKPVYVAVSYSGPGHLERCRAVIALFRPTYFCYAIEANDLDAAAQAELLGIYRALKTEHPGVIIFASVQSTFDYQAAEAEAIVAASDVWAISIYPFLQDSILSLPAAPESALGKPVVIAETGWAAELLTHPRTTATILSANPLTQAAYMSVLRKLPVTFFMWFTYRDLDAYPEMSHGVARPFRDMGLLDGMGEPRPALGEWRR